MFTAASQHPYGSWKYVYRMTYRPKDLSERIRDLRKARGLSQGELAERIKVSRPAVTQWENGDTKNLRIDNLLSLARAFDMTVDELITGKSPKVAEPHPRYQSTIHSADEDALIQKYRLLDKSDRNKLQAIASALDADHKTQAS